MSLVDDYIEKCDGFLQKTEKEKDALIGEITSVFSTDLPQIYEGLDVYNHYHPENEAYDYDGDLRKLKSKLLLYHEKSLGKNAVKSRSAPSQVFNITQNNENTVSIQMNIDIVIEQIEKLEQSGELSEEDKDILVGKLSAIERDKKKGAKKAELWGKVANTLKWIADKGVQVGIATLPYIFAALQNAPQ